MPETKYTADEMMTIAAARMIRNGASCFVGIGLPSAAANLARLTHAPDTVLIYESGCIGTKPTVLPLSIGDGELSETADAVVSIPEIFAYWLQGGRIDLGFLGAAQIDRFANINTTVIGDYHKPSVRLPGAGGAPEIAASSKEVLITLRQNKRAFIEKLDFVTSGGHFTGGDSRAKMNLPGKGPTAVITDLGIMTPGRNNQGTDANQPASGSDRRKSDRIHRLGTEGGAETCHYRAAYRNRAARPSRSERTHRARSRRTGLMPGAPLAFAYDMLPSRVIFGAGCLDKLPEEIDRLGAHRALVLSTPEQRKEGQQMVDRLGARAAGLFHQAVMHVPIEIAEQAREQAKALGADCCVAVGGGSTTGLAKAIALVSTLPILVHPNHLCGIGNDAHLGHHGKAD